MRNTRWFIAAVLSLSVIHCAFSFDHVVLPESSDKTPFFANIAIDDSIDATDTLIAKLALTEWNVALNGNLTVSYFVAKEPSISCLRILDDESYVSDSWRSRIEGGEVVLGYVENTCINIVKRGVQGLAWSNGVSYERMLKTVILHEFGHYIGMRHVFDSQSLMNRAYSAATPQCVTGDDAMAACDAIGRPGENCMATCGIYDI